MPVLAKHARRLPKTCAALDSLLTTPNLRLKCYFTPFPYLPPPSLTSPPSSLKRHNLIFCYYVSYISFAKFDVITAGKFAEGG